MTNEAGATERHHLPVLDNGTRATWPLYVVERDYPNLTLTLTGPHQTWTATGTDVFGAVLNLREQLDAVGVRLCCNGARRNAWASGMQRDMARGRFVYLLGDEPGHPGQVPALDPAPCDQVVTVQEQKEFYSSWLARRTAAGD